MPENLFGALFTVGAADVAPADFMICVAVALAAGLGLAAAYTFRSGYTRSFVTALVLLPATVCVVIMMVSGSIGAGVAVAGTFSLVRFRSVPGTAREILAVFLAMSAGIIAGVGYIAYCLLFTLIMAAALMLCGLSPLGDRGGASLKKTYRVTIPEDLDYSGVFDDLFEKYAQCSRLTCVKTANMGSMYKLTYDLTLKPGVFEKELIDAMRCRNGNLEISSCDQSTEAAGL